MERKEEREENSMGRYWKIGAAFGLLVTFMFVSAGEETPSAFIEVEVKGVRLDASGQNPVVILADKEGRKAIPIWIGVLEANAIDKELRHVASPRPMTHDLIYSILEQLKTRVKEVRITEMREATYYAKLFLGLDKQGVEIDARPSDAMVIALKCKAPIFVSARILEEQGISLWGKNPLGERHGIRVQELTPSLATHFNFGGGKGVLVSEVIPKSVSESSGIRAGDIITQIGRKEVGTVQGFEEAMDAAPAGSPVSVSVFRNGRSIEVKLFPKP